MIRLFVFVVGLVFFPVHVFGDTTSDTILEPVSIQTRIALVGDSNLKGKFLIGRIQGLIVEKGFYGKVGDFSEEGAGMYRIAENAIRSLRRFSPTHLVVLGGVNDCAGRWFNGDQRAREVIYYLREISIRALRRGVDVILIKHHPWCGSRYDVDGEGWQCSGLVNDWIEDEWFLTDGVTVIQTSWLGYGSDGHSERDCVKLRLEVDAGDGLHLNRSGQIGLAEKIFEAVSDAGF